MFDKLQDKEIEEIIIGTILIAQNETAVSENISKISESDFYYEQLKIIFRAVQELYITNKKIDILTVCTYLKSKGSIENVGGAYYVSTLTNRVVSSDNFEQHVNVLIDLSSRRNLITLCSSIMQKAVNIENTVDYICSELTKGVNDTFGKISQEKEVSMSDIIQETNEHIEKASLQKGLTGTTTGRNTLDRIYGGRQGGKMYIMAARPAMGKSANAMNEVVAAGLKKEPVAFFNLEMGNNETMMRMLAHLTGINSNDINKGKINSEQWKEIFKAETQLLDAPIYLFDNIFKLTPIVNKIRKLVSEKGIRTVYIDYLQLVQHDLGKNGNREQEVSTISRVLKQLTTELKISIVALSQLNRSVESRGGDKIPLLSDLRESGSIEQDADVVEFIYRPEYYGIKEDANGEPTDNACYILIKKHRGGGLCDVRLKMNKETSTINEFDFIPNGDYKAIIPETNNDLKPLANFYEVEKEEDDFLDDNDNPF